MSSRKGSGVVKRFFSAYGMIVALALLCVYYSVVTMQEQFPNGKEAAVSVAKQLSGSSFDNVIIVADNSADGLSFVKDSKAMLEGKVKNIIAVNGDPRSLKEALDNCKGQRLDAILASRQAADWKLFASISDKYPEFASAQKLSPKSYRYPDFLKKANMMAIADRIVVIAIIAIGMTMVIITGGIDLSVGSFIALSAIISSYLIATFGGGVSASPMFVIFAFLVAIAISGMIGMFTGAMVTKFGVAPFIVTLAMMMVARGIGYIIAGGQSIYKLPDGITWLGRGTDLFGIPNTVVLMLVLYVIAHIVMTKTTFGRYVYAVGGNEEAARLSGVPTKLILFSVYIICSALAGLGGIIQTSQLKSGSPTYGNMYELYVIAAVVVGGTSLSGGEGKIFGTLIGALIIAVIQNGMNLTGVESYTQMVVLGLVILAAVLLDKIKRGNYLAKLVSIFSKS